MEAIVQTLRRQNVPQNTVVAVFGEGPMSQIMLDAFQHHGLGSRLYLCGVVKKNDVPQAYRAMDIYTFASQSETQGMVLTEAMACGVPVVAIDAPGFEKL